MRVLVTGARGLVGRAVVLQASTIGDEVFAYDRQTLDIADRSTVESTIASLRPQAVINCAAWTDVDGCERDPERARNVNAIGPENLARACRNVDAVLVTISTDYVFDGEKEGFYTQRDRPNPISIYGKYKLEGERRAQFEHARTIVVRTGYIFGPGGRNFLSNVVARAQRSERLKVIGDCWGTPTYGRDLAERLRELAVLDLPGTYHVVSSGEGASFETFALEALRLARIENDILEVVTSDSLARPAPRPRNSKMKCLLSEAVGLPPMLRWEEALAHFIKTDTEVQTSAQA